MSSRAVDRSHTDDVDVGQAALAVTVGVAIVHDRIGIVGSDRVRIRVDADGRAVRRRFRGISRQVHLMDEPQHMAELVHTDVLDALRIRRAIRIEAQIDLRVLAWL